MSNLESLYSDFQRILIDNTSNKILQDMIDSTIDGVIKDLYLAEMLKRRKERPEEFI